MALYVYYDLDNLVYDYRSDKKMLEQRIRNWMMQLEESQSILHLDRYSNGSYKKKFEKLRAVGWIYNVGEEDTLLAWSFMFQRGRMGYEDFLSELNQPVKPLRFDRPDHESDFFRKAKLWYEQEKQRNARKPLEPLSDSEAIYLSGFQMHTPSPEQVYETAEWVGAIHKHFFPADQQLQAQRLPALEDIRRYLANVDVNEERHDCVQVGDYYVEYMCKKRDDTDQHALILIDIDTQNGKTEKYGLNVYVRKAALRAYDRNILTEVSSGRWLRLQKYPKSALAFSAEQMELLHETLSLDSELASVRLPLFINGCAGSGKTTILYYLFEQYVMQYFEQSAKSELDLKPIYLSYSENLIRNAKQHITQMVRERSGDEQLELPPVLFDFRSFLLGYLDEQERSKFPASKRVYYDRFRARFDESFKGNQANGLTADRVWHVIRTFIKGYDCDIEEAKHNNNLGLHLSADEYEELPTDWKHVSDDEYRLIYTRFYENWYLSKFPRSEGYWDDQDLIHYVLLHKEIKPEYGAVFADEVQDFTNVEFLFLLKLTPYYQRKLYAHQISQLPFVYVGDPYQTIQPTGFDWKILRKHYYDRFIRTLDPNQQSNMREIRICDLEFNYRSAPSIVHLSNSVQRLRNRWLGKNNSFMQKSWQLPTSESPMVYLADEIGAEHPIWQVGPEIIIPVNDYRVEKDDGSGVSSIVEFIERDSFLGPVINIDEQREIAQNVWNSAKAKGLEFEEVILYGFGQYFADHRKQWFPAGANKQASSNFYQEKEFFINKLYVSVTRARKRLIIVDTKAGIEQFWLNNDVFPSTDEQMLLSLNKGDAVSLKYVDSNALDKAVMWEKLANEQSSTEMKRDLLQRARQFYIAATFDVADEDVRASYLLKATRCQAFAEYYAALDKDFVNFKQWEPVLQLLEQAQEYAYAAEVYWRLGEFASLVRVLKLLGEHPDWSEKLAMAELLSKTSLTRAEIIQIVQGVETVSTATEDQSTLLNKLCSVIENYLKEQMANDSSGETDTSLFNAITDSLDEYVKISPVVADLLAYAHYRLERYESASHIWEKHSKSKGSFRALYLADAQGKMLHGLFSEGAERKWSGDDIRRLSSYYREQNEFVLLQQLLETQGDASAAIPIIADMQLASDIRIRLAVAHLQKVQALEDEAFVAFVEETKKWQNDKRNYLRSMADVLGYCSTTTVWTNGYITFQNGNQLPELVKILSLFDVDAASRIQFEDRMIAWLQQQHNRKPRTKEHSEAKRAIEQSYELRKMEEMFRFIYVLPQNRVHETAEQYEQAIQNAKLYVNMMKALKPEDWYRFSIKRAVEQIRRTRLAIEQIVQTEFNDKQFRNLQTELNHWIQQVRTAATAKGKVKQSMQGLNLLEAYENVDFKAFFRHYDLTLQNVERDIDLMFNWQFNSSKARMELAMTKARNALSALFNEKSLLFTTEKVVTIVSDFGWKNHETKTNVQKDLQHYIEELKQEKTHVAKFSAIQQRIKGLLDVSHIVMEDKRDLTERLLKSILPKLEKNYKNFMKNNTNAGSSDESGTTEVAGTAQGTAGQGEGPLVVTAVEHGYDASLSRASLVQAPSNIYDVMKVIAQQMGNVDNERYHQMEQTLLQLHREERAKVDTSSATDV